MADKALERRLAMALLEAALIRSGFADHSEIPVRIGTEDPAVVRAAVLGLCEIKDGADAGNSVSVENRYDRSERMTHVVVDHACLSVPEIVVQRFRELRSALLTPKDAREKVDHGWKLALDMGGDDRAAVVVQLNLPTARPIRVHPAAFAIEFSDALNVPVRIELGQLAYPHDGWAKAEHAIVATGLSIGDGNTSASLTVPVRYLDEARAPRRRRTARMHTFLTVAHAFQRFARGASNVYQPAHNVNPNRLIGNIVLAAYDERHGASNYFDAALGETAQVASLVFGKREHMIEGVWAAEGLSNDRFYIYGAMSGLKPVSIDSLGDANVTMITDSGLKLIYRDMIEFSNDDDNDKPASLPGDSGGALLVKHGGRFLVAGLIIGGGDRRARSRKPKSYAVPIQRVLDRFEVAIF